MKKNIFDPQMILNHLAENDNDKLQIFLTNSPTNYNFNLKTLFLSYQDITKIKHLLTKINPPPFKIQKNETLMKNYYFSKNDKILMLKPEFMPHAVYYQDEKSNYQQHHFLTNIATIIQTLSKQQKAFKVFLSEQKTNYNLQKNMLFLNYYEVQAFQTELKKEASPPFTIVMKDDLKTDYFFETTTKTLILTKDFLNLYVPGDNQKPVKIKGLTSILDYLQREPQLFNLVVSKFETNFNIRRKMFYLNEQDLLQLVPLTLKGKAQIVKKISIMADLKTKYQFDAGKKVLQLQAAYYDQICDVKKDSMQEMLVHVNQSIAKDFSVNSENDDDFDVQQMLAQAQKDFSN